MPCTAILQTNIECFSYKLHTKETNSKNIVCPKTIRRYTRKKQVRERKKKIDGGRVRLLSAVDLGVPGSLLPGTKKPQPFDCGRVVCARLAEQRKTLLLVHLVL